MASQTPTARFTRETAARYPASWLGGKGAALIALRKAGFPVPPLEVLEVGWRDAEFPGLDGAAFDEAMLHELRDQLSVELEPSGPVEQLRYAVRSSAAVEDGAEQSFAGQFETVLDVAWHDIPAAFHRVMQSAAAARVGAYRGGDRADVGMAVIVQEMVPATVSGVAFGAHPVSGEAVLVVNAVAGMGDALVSGEVTGEQYLLHSDGRVVSAPNDGLLQAEQLIAVADCMARLQQYFGRPQDAEFAFVGDRFYLLQSRPITTVRGERTVWDNSNIVESYPGLTLPLTFSFIEKMYAAVYRQFSLVLGVAPGRVARAENTYQSMLGLLNGRVYYNLNSWYRALAQLPGYSLNAGFMEKMMGVRDKPEIDLGDTEKPTTWRGWWDVLRALSAILRNLRSARNDRHNFEATFNEVHAAFAAKDFSHANLGALLDDYHRFETLLVREWKAPLSNDFFAMIYFGLLQKTCARFLPGDPTLHNRLLAASGDVATTAPLKRLPLLARDLAASPALKQALQQGDADTAWHLLQHPEQAGARAAFDRYLADWGERVAEELKLETVSYTDNPKRLLAVLAGYVQAGLFTPGEENTADRHAAEYQVAAALRGKPLRRRIFYHVLRQARYFVANRENLRYYRTRGFATVRRMMRAVGDALHQDGILAQPEAVFYLRLDELEALRNGSLPPDALQQRVAERQVTYTQFANQHLPQRIITWGTPQRLLVAPTADVPPPQSGAGQLTGIPCSPGIVLAQIRKVRDVASVSDLGQCILATYATDPGYVVLFPSAAGILTERGSLLSHAAIVSREMNIPCIVGIDGLMARLQDGDWVEMDGSTGTVTVLP